MAGKVKPPKTPTYRTFKRSARNFREFANRRKRTVDRGLTYDEARRACENYNKELTSNEKTRGTMMEFEVE